MSYRRQTVVIEPVEGGRNVRELVVLRGFMCPYCNGRGWHLGPPMVRESAVETCPRCGGSGGLRACVTVEWSGDG